MTQSMTHEAYNVNLIIADHFDEIILKIDKPLCTTTSNNYNAINRKEAREK